MPTFKGVTVEIHCPKEPPADPENFSWTTVEHGATPEYGVHKLRHTPKMTAYIPAVTNCPFAVSIAILDSYEPKVKGDDRESLAAYVYFDGKQKEETATLLRRGVETWISSRWIEVGEGKLAEREFVFREVGLENIFNILDISKDKTDSDKNRRHSMPASMNHKEEEDSKAAKPKESAGQIRVDLFRVRCEGPVRRGVWGDMFKDSQNGLNQEPQTVDDVDVSHTAGFSEPKPLDKETVSTQSVSHLDPDGVVFASFIFLYRSERQLRKMGLIKTPATNSGSLTAGNTPIKPSRNEFGAASGPNELIPKGPDLFRNKSNGFQGFRDQQNQSSSANKTSKHKLIRDDDDDDDEVYSGDALGRDERDLQRERMKTAEEIRMEEELAAEVNRIKLKRTHSGKEEDDDEDDSPAPGQQAGQFDPKSLAPADPKLEPETPAKKKRGNTDSDVKSPPSAAPSRSLNFGGATESGQAQNFGGFLAGGSGAMDEEEL